MGYNKLIYSIVLCFALFLGSFIVAQGSIGFGTSVPRPGSPQGLPTNVQQNQSPSRMAVDLFVLHLQHHNAFVAAELGLLSLTQQVQLSITTDIIALLDQSTDKQSVLDSYIVATDLLLRDAEGQLEITFLRLGVLREAMRQCLLDKDIADRAFFDAVTLNDDLAARSAVENSSRASVCATDYRVQLNALQAQYDKLLFYVKVLQKKYNYISDKRDNIVQYFFVLKSDLLNDLTKIAAELQSFVLTR